MINLSHSNISQILENNTKNHIEREEVKKREIEKNEGIANKVYKFISVLLYLTL